MVSEKAVKRATNWRRGQTGRGKDVNGKSPPAEVSPGAGTPIERLGRADGELLALHRARFTEWEPTAVVSLAAAGDGTALAVAREGGSVEIWETDYWSCVSTLVGTRDLAVTSLVWLQEEGSRAWRLFSGGLDGSLTEWDIVGRKPKHRVDALGGAVWAMAAQPATQEGPSCRVAVACDDGCLRLFRAEAGEPGLLYEASFAPAPSRLLSVAWHPSGNTLVGGTANGSLHAWKLASRREVLQIRTGDERKETQEVWAVAALADGTMVTGDAGGNVQFWGAAFGDLISSHRRHIADVTALAASPDGTRVVASGVDHQVALFQKVLSDKGQPVRWEFTVSKRPHTHDVRAMAVVLPEGKQPLLVSGGCDAQLFAYRLPRFTQEHPFRLTTAPEAPRIQIAPGQQGSSPALLLSTQRDKCDLWRLGSESRQQDATSPQSADSGGSSLEVAAWPLHLARLSSSSGFTASALSPDGSLLAACDAEGVHLYAVEQQEGSHAVALKHKALPSLTRQPCVSLAFSEHKLLLASASGTVTIIDVAAGRQEGAIHVPTALARPKKGAAAAQAMAASMSVVVSSDGKHAALVRPWEAHVLGVDGLCCRGHVLAGEAHGPITAAAFDGSGELLALGTADNALLLHDVPGQKPADVEERLAAALSARLGKMSGSISCVSFLPSPERKVVFVSTPNAVCFVDLAAPIQPLPPVNKRQRRKRGRESEAAASPGTNARVLDWPDVCLSCSFTSDRSAVVVEKDWARVLAKFPPPVYRHRYGS